MAYRLRDDEPIMDGLVRIVVEQIDRSLAEVADPQLSRPDAVHEVRKRCKKIRGLLRLARTALPDMYRSQDDWFRDASRRLANVRQADATIVALESLRSAKPDRLADAVVDCVRDALARCHRRSSEETGIDAPLAEFAGAMQTARHRVEQWPKERTGSDDLSAAIIDGFKRTYRRGRRALRTAEQIQADEYVHEFRKWAKYHWHHLKLLEDLSPKKSRRRAKRLAELSDLLGDDRDLATLRHELLEQSQAADRPGAEHPLAGHADEVDKVVAAIDHRRGRLRSKAFGLAKKLYQVKPKAYARRLAKRWKSAA